MTSLSDVRLITERRRPCPGEWGHPAADAAGIGQQRGLDPEGALLTRLDKALVGQDP